ncbi:MAG: type II secretion system protein GspG [Chlamydiae bacterium]|nr:type II secretion system protein GspG [Chlamydiota bacterium]MBI3265780.1 type II secretion system protein GspG [Chlamydiota bacterium]
MKKAYTLVEVLIVMSIMGVVMAFLLNAVLKARQKVHLSRAHLMMDSIGAALRMYEDDFGAYPPSDEILGIPRSSAECLYYYLGATFVKGVNASRSAGPYMKFQGAELGLTVLTACDFDGEGSLDDDLKEILDPWESAYHYAYPPVNNLNTYDLYSQGPNGVNENGDGDDVNNWE